MAISSLVLFSVSSFGRYLPYLSLMIMIASARSRLPEAARVAASCNSLSFRFSLSISTAASAAIFLTCSWVLKILSLNRVTAPMATEIAVAIQPHGPALTTLLNTCVTSVACFVMAIYAI